MTQSVHHCSFLHVFEIREMFSQGDVQRGRQAIESLKPAWQEKIYACLRKVENPLRTSSIAHQEVPIKWDITTQHAVDALSLFLKEYAREKIAKETAEAQNDQFLTYVDKLKAARDMAPDEEKKLWEDHITYAKVRKLPVPFAKAASGPNAYCFTESLLPRIDQREIGVAFSQGTRQEMEDRVALGTFAIQVGEDAESAEYYAVCDGHGGEAAAEYVKMHIEKYLTDSLQRFNSMHLTDEGVFAALKAAFIRMDKGFTVDHSGSTVTLALILKNALWVANIGDSRVVLNNAGQAIQMSEDQKCLPKYAKKVVALGGIILGMRVNRVLEVPRAIGDHAIEGLTGECVVSSAPKITKFPMDALAENAAMVLASDGLWDVCSTQDAVDFVDRHSDDEVIEVARSLAVKAYNTGSKDNLAVIVVRFKKEAH